MEPLIFLFTFLAVIFIAQYLFAKTSSKSEDKKATPVYRYGRKEYIMTRAEHNFFLLLIQAINERYHVFPQVHLSSILNEKYIKGQNWKAAFKHINGKSVDFVICDKQFAKPLLAIELDDWSHASDSRKKRDVEVERIFIESGLPLLRFSDYKNLSFADVESKIDQAIKKN